MDWVKIVYSFILLACGILIFISSSSRKGDERKKFIKLYPLQALILYIF
ncbi:hypothetical protein ACLNAR_00365 [Priestia aryabhattai]